MSHPNSHSKEEKNKAEESQVWPERDEQQERLPRQVIKWLISLKLRSKFLHPRWDAASGVLVAEILSRYYPTTGPGYILSACYGNGWKHFQKNWFFLKQFFKSARLDFPEELVAPLMTRKGNAGYFALVWLWEIFERKTKLIKVEKGALAPCGQSGGGKDAPPTYVNADVIKNVDFFHHDRRHQGTLSLSQRETQSTCFRQNVTGNQMKWDDCQQTWAQWSNRLWEEQMQNIELLKKSHPKRMGKRETGILWRGIRVPAGDAERAGSLGTLSSGKRTNANQEGSVSEILHHANIHAGYK